VLVGDPDTTNNRMALTGAITVLELMARKESRFRVLFVSDSEYLVKGIREWAPGWERRGWTRKGGVIENLELWQSLVVAARRHEAQWTWVRGHKGHAKNEYANDLAVKAAKEQITSDGAVASGFETWMAARREKKLYLDYDADAAFTALEERLARDEKFLLREEA
jgi:ribonuclease HI